MIQHRYVAHFYQDSVTLMQFSRNWKAKGPFGEVSAVMATEANLTLLAESGLVDSGLAARPNDLLLVLSGASVTEADLDAAEAELRAPPRPQEGTAVLEAARSVGEAVSRDPGLNFALISVPGGYAAAEALKALSRGLHVMLFSDNVSVEQEVALKDEGLSRGLLVLGPDCGTAIVNGVPLGFANRVRRGPVGLVSASGTGLQEVSSLLDRWGTGVSQALGTGGRDLKDAVGGRTALACLNLLDRDPETRVIVLLGKAPGARTRVALEAAAAGLSKPVVFCFLGDEGSPTLAGAAHRAFALATGSSPSADLRDEVALPVPPTRSGRFLRGLYSGGTLCAEAAFLASRVLGEVRANVSVPGVQDLEDLWSSRGHCLVDLGEDEFTRGRPHPMIDPSLRISRLAAELADPETGAILLDLVLGYGAHPDPGTEFALALERLPRRPGFPPALFASVTGTEGDPQGWSRTVSLLRRAGVCAFGSHEEAVSAALTYLTSPEAP